MKLLSVGRTYRNLIRIKEILQVLSKHGFGHLVSRLNLAIHLPSLRQIGILSQLPAHLSQDSTSVRLRMVLQELGPTFVKLGQVLSGRPDILSEDMVHEFKLLQDRVPPFPTDKAIEIIEKEFKRKSEDVFASFDQEVLASGSIGQVHCALLPNNTEVIVKIRRPGIEKLIATDIAILHFLAELAEKYISELRFFQPIMIVEEFARTIQREMDFTAEAAYTEKFYSLLKNENNVASPKVYWEYTTSNIITLERLKGINIGEKDALRRMGIDLKDLAKRMVSSFMQQYFVWGMFHADPHPGNILVGEEGKIYLVDFGMVGHLSEELKSQLSTTVLALVKDDIDTIIEVYADIGVVGGEVSRRELKSDVLEMLDKYFNTPFQHLDISKVFQDIVQIGRTHKIMLPRDFILLGKSIVMAASVARDLDPDFNLAKAASPHFAAILREKFSPRRLLNMSIFQMWSFFSLFQKLPLEIKEILRRIKSGNMRLIVQHESMEKYIYDFRRIFNRLSFSIVLSAILLCSTLLMTSGIGPKFQEIPLLGIIGYGIGAIMGLWFLVAIFRSDSM
mgnify:FL=1